MQINKNDESADQIMKRIRSSLGRENTIREPAPPSSRLAPIPMAQIDLGAIDERIKTAEGRSLIPITSPSMNRYPSVVRPFAKLAGQAFLFFGQLITKPQENYNVAVVQAMSALEDGIRVLAEHQTILVKEVTEIKDRVAEIAATKEHMEEFATVKKRVGELNAENCRIVEALAEQRRSLIKEIARIDKVIVENVKPSMDDALYVAFENKFRGTRQEIKERAHVYLSLIERALGSAGGGSILDVGCGRGEWLELLREQNISASGIDSNRVMVEECRSHGLAAEQADVIEYLKCQNRETFTVVTGFHLIEHLPLNVWITLLDETLRILKPGGVAIFETPNPENVLVGSNTFYFDPTHRNPLPSAIVQFIANERGFNPVEIMPLHAADPESLLAEGTDVANKFNYYFCGPRDYAIVGWKK